MSHRDAEELAAEIAYMQDDPSFRPKKDPLNEPDSPEASIERLEFKNKKLQLSSIQNQATSPNQQSINYAYFEAQLHMIL